MMEYFTFGDFDCRDCGVHISGSGTYDMPAKDVEEVTVPGRSGDLIIDNDRFDNIDITYPAFIVNNFSERIDDLKAELLRRTGYQRLEDTYHPNEYRMGFYNGGLAFSPGPLNSACEFKLTFRCKPQRFLKSGEKAVTLTNTGIIKNPTAFKSKPLLRIYGTGTLKLNSQTITINSASTYTDVDCEIMEAYMGSTNCNANVSLPDSLYLVSGQNTITLTGVTQVDITPRWWSI